MYSFNNNRTILIINPKAGNKRIAFLYSRLEKYKDFFDYSTFSDINEFRSFVRKNLENYDLFIAVGGDGTVNSLASELVGTDKVLGVIPAGSGNGFAREMGFKKNLDDLVQCIQMNRTYYSDVLYINSLPCVNICGVGIDSFVAHTFHNLHRRGFWKYVMVTLRTAASVRPFEIKLDIKDASITEDVYMVSFANTRQFGNNALVAPMAAPNDGKFNIAILRPFPWLLYPLFAARLMTGTLKESKFLRYIESEDPVSITSSEKRYHIDGEPVLINDKINIHIRKNALRVLATKHTRWI